MARSSNFIDLTGQRFGRLTVISYVSQSRWLCQCDCGQQTTVKSQAMRRGDTRSCGCLAREMVTKGNGWAARQSIITSYRAGAERRGFEWTLSEAEFDQLTSAACTYCGSPPSQVRTLKGCMGSFVYTGIDRVDNTLGYSSENSVSCCTTCNLWKGKMSHDEFISHLTKVAKHLGVQC